MNRMLITAMQSAVVQHTCAKDGALCIVCVFGEVDEFKDFIAPYFRENMEMLDAYLTCLRAQSPHSEDSRWFRRLCTHGSCDLFEAAGEDFLRKHLKKPVVRKKVDR